MFGDILRKLRVEQKLTQSELGKKIKVSASAIGMYEQNRRSPDIETLNKVAEFFGTTTDYLLERENTSNLNSPIELNAKDEKDIAKDVDSIMSKIKAGEDGPTYYNGVPMDEDDAELFEQALEFALRSIKIENKQKYTPKKYRK